MATIGQIKVALFDRIVASNAEAAELCVHSLVFRRRGADRGACNSLLAEIFTSSVGRFPSCQNELRKWVMQRAQNPDMMVNGEEITLDDAGSAA